MPVQTKRLKVVTLFLSVSLGLSFSTSTSRASEIINVQCERTEFKSRNQYLSKALGYDLGIKNLYLDFRDRNNVIIQTNMGTLINNDVIFFETKGVEISLITGVDNMNRMHHFSINRSTGIVGVVRFVDGDESLTEISVHDCQAASKKF